MTIPPSAPPSAPPVLAEEPAAFERVESLAKWYEYQRIRVEGQAAHDMAEDARALRQVLAQARQGREDAERRITMAPDWSCPCGGRAYRSTAIGWQCLFCYAVYPATPSPSPEGA